MTKQEKIMIERMIETNEIFIKYCEDDDLLKDALEAFKLSNKYLHQALDEEKVKE